VKDNGKKILVVDNEIDITLLIEEGLEQRDSILNHIMIPNCLARVQTWFLRSYVS
jgi:hypothetical protein